MGRPQGGMNMGANDSLLRGNRCPVRGSRTGTSARVSGVSGMTVCSVVREVATR